MSRWEAAAVELEEEEARLHGAADPALANVLQGKRLIVFKKMLEEIECVNKGLSFSHRPSFLYIGQHSGMICGV